MQDRASADACNSSRICFETEPNQERLHRLWRLLRGRYRHRQHIFVGLQTRPILVSRLNRINCARHPLSEPCLLWSHSPEYSQWRSIQPSRCMVSNLSRPLPESKIWLQFPAGPAQPSLTLLPSPSVATTLASIIFWRHAFSGLGDTGPETATQKSRKRMRYSPAQVSPPTLRPHWKKSLTPTEMTPSSFMLQATWLFLIKTHPCVRAHRSDYTTLTTILLTKRKASHG